MMLDALVGAYSCGNHLSAVDGLLLQFSQFLLALSVFGNVGYLRTFDGLLMAFDGSLKSGDFGSSFLKGSVCVVVGLLKRSGGVVERIYFQI